MIRNALQQFTGYVCKNFTDIIQCLDPLENHPGEVSPKRYSKNSEEGITAIAKKNIDSRGPFQEPLPHSPSPPDADTALQETIKVGLALSYSTHIMKIIYNCKS